MCHLFGEDGAHGPAMRDGVNGALQAKMAQHDPERQQRHLAEVNIGFRRGVRTSRYILTGETAMAVVSFAS